MSDGKWQFWGSVIAALIGLFGTLYGFYASKEEKVANKALEKQQQASASQRDNYQKAYQKLLGEYQRLKTECENSGLSSIPNFRDTTNINDPKAGKPQEKELPNPITWRDGAKDYEGRLGQSFLLGCPPNGSISSHIYGSRIYTIDSKICTAAVHEGKINAKDGGIVRIEVLAGQDKYYSADKNGVPTRRWGRYHSSFKFVDK